MLKWLPPVFLGTTALFVSVTGTPAAGFTDLALLAIGCLFAVFLKWLDKVAALHALVFGVSCDIFAGFQVLVFPAVFLVFGSLFSRTKTEHIRGRSAVQVWSNGGVFAFFLALDAIFPANGFSGAALSSITCAFSDTSASAAGALFPEQTRDIISWRKSPSGTDGGVTIAGFAAAFLSAGFFSSLLLLLFTVSTRACTVIGLIGFSGSVVDSYLGALFQNRKNRFSLTNDDVNLISTAVSALIYLGLDYYGLV